MKSTKAFLFLVFIISLIIISGCTKKGDIGPQGPQGASGTTGATGPSGTTVPVIVQDFTVGPSDWQHNGTAGTAGAHDYYYYHSNSLTTDVMNGGAVLLYQAVTVDGSPGYSAVPNSYYNTAGHLISVRFAYTTQKLDVQFYVDDFNFATFSSGVTFRTVIIPGTGKKDWPIDLKDYNAVKAYFHLKD